MNPLVTVITLNWNRKDDVLRTLEGIDAQSYEPVEVIVVDNASADGSVAEIRKRFPSVKVVELSRNVGVAGYNEGMRMAQGDLLVLIDNDMDLLQQNTLELLAGYFRENAGLGAAALQVRDQSGVRLSANNPKYWEEQGDEIHGYPCSTFDGGGVAFRKAVLDQVGFYLPEFFVYHSEVDMSTRIWDSGYEIRYFPAVAVRHRESEVSRNRAAHTFYATRNYLWYVWIYYPPGLAVAETLHFLQRSFIQNLRARRPLGAWIRGAMSAAAGWPRLPVKRKPARKETIRWMQTLRVRDRERKERTGNAT